MPELPEIETTKEGIKTHLEKQMIRQIIVRNPRLRIPVAANLNESCADKTIVKVARRAKYLFLFLDKGYLLIHLGMSGHLRVVPNNTPIKAHDHIDIVLSSNLILRYCDPRRFGLMLYSEDHPKQHPLLAHLGPEPLTTEFDAEYLYNKTRQRTLPIKSFIMNNSLVVGVGNIYATESLFLAGIHPKKPAKALSYEECDKLTRQIKQVLHLAIEAGGTTLKDFYTAEGNPGYFSIALKVYGRKQQPCFDCSTLVDVLLIGGRHSAFCPKCQPF